MGLFEYLPKCGAVPLFARTTEVEVRRFEEVVGTSLPDAYREFLLKWNGARFTSDCRTVYPIQPLENHSRGVPTWDSWQPRIQRSIDDNIWTVSRLYGLHQDDRDSMWVTSKTPELNAWFPDRFLAIGDVDDNIEVGQILISLDQPDKGQVFCFTFPVDGPVPGVNCPSMDYMWWIAPAFDGFWASLREISLEEYREWR